MVERLVKGDWARALLGYLLGAELSGASLAVGHHAAAALWHAHAHSRRREGNAAAASESSGGVTGLVGEPPPRATSHPAPTELWAEDAAAAVVLAAALAGCVAGLARSPVAAWRIACLAALCGPVGVVLRWQLSRLNGSLRAAPWLPLGTLAANVIACVFDAALGAAAVRTRLGRGQYWSAVLDAALEAGIGGGLSTVSTAAGEAALLLSVPGARWRGYAYLMLTLAASLGPAGAIYGGATRGHRAA